jgi:hypothetical protein
VQYKPGGTVPVIRDTSTELGNAASQEGGGLANFSQVAVDPQGNLCVSMFNGSLFRVFRSTDGGATFNLTTNPFVTGTATQIANTQLTSGGPSHAFPVRDIVADPTRPNTVYAADAIQVFNGNVSGPRLIRPRSTSPTPATAARTGSRPSPSAAARATYPL